MEDGNAYSLCEQINLQELMLTFQILIRIAKDTALQ